MKYFTVVEVDGAIRSAISVYNRPDKYSPARTFGNKRAAANWIAKHTYKGMSVRYEIVEHDTEDSDHGKDYPVYKPD